MFGKILFSREAVCRVCLPAILILLCVNILPASCDVDQALLCSRDYCRTQNCTAVPEHCSINNATHSGVNMLDPTFCNCCEYCLINLLEGVECSQGGLGAPPTGNICGPGLSCQNTGDTTTCQRMKTPCHEAQDSYDQRREDGTLGSTEQRPECDGEGLFAPRVCLPGQTCYCQNKAGVRIFGEALYDNTTIHTMTCGCSRISDKAKTLDENVPVPMRCNADGSFDPIQCVDSRCFCVNRQTGILGSSRIIDLRSQPLSDLPCFDSSIHHSRVSYLRPCEEDFLEMTQEIEKAEAEGYSILGNPLPICQPDGWYDSIMLDQNRKVCVDRRRNPIGDYQALQNTAAANNMDCKCAVTEKLIEDSNIPSFPPTCCPNGNWKKLQCRRGKCFCVDSNGVQKSPDTDMAQVETLPCYINSCDV